MEFTNLGSRALRKIDINKYYLGNNKSDPDMLFDGGDLSVEDLFVDGKSIQGIIDESFTDLEIEGKPIAELLQDLVEQQAKITTKNYNLSDFATSLELPTGESSIRFKYTDIGYVSLNDNLPHIVSALRIPENSEILYQYSINEISLEGFTLTLSDEIQESNTILDLRISQTLNEEQIATISKVSSDIINLDPNTMFQKNQYTINFNQQYLPNQKIAVICSLNAGETDPIILSQVVHTSNTQAVVKFSADIPNTNYKLSYIGYPL